MKSRIAILPGDGIGPEVMNEALKVLDVISQKSGIKFDFNKGLVGASAIDEYGDPFPDQTKSICDESDAILFGAIGDPKYDNDPKAKIRPEDGLLEMRKYLELFSNVRPVKTYESLINFSPIKKDIISGTNFVVFRELTGGIYFGEKGISDDKSNAFDTCTYDINEIERISHLAFKEAQRRKKKLTLIDKANVLATSRLWREVVQNISKNYPDVTVSFLFVDNAAMKIITNPKDFDVILTENMFGDIITDEASVITGSLGMLPSASVGNNISLYEPIHGSYPQAAGKGIANPMAMILSVSMMLSHSFNLLKESELIEKSVNEALKNSIVTVDINKENNFSTSYVGDWIANKLVDLY
ncbi:MAG: 3-isopropylmalate dehydrogenase [Bacteroidota bacterium]|nr:3-isopropylmalate dehydrogenase [Bacteroidota bacterium]|tara:strand:+ start:32 stop:1099 length:1068 start_codon:yes stop_codon:yes gene_type:complete